MVFMKLHRILFCLLALALTLPEIGFAQDVAPYNPADLPVIGLAKPGQLGFQPAVSPIKEEIETLHDAVTITAAVIVVVVMALLGFVCIRFRKSANPVPSKVTHNTTVEIVWTVIPILILIAIAIPSLRAHFSTVFNYDTSDMTLKVVGHQWYWSYEYPEAEIAFDSNLKKKEELREGEPYLLAVDNPVVVPAGAKVKVQMTSADVIHSWAMPAFGVKKDTVPGKLNETWFQVDKIGIYYGQCSELCGKFHGYMPIEIHVVSPETYEAWVEYAKQKYAANRYGTVELAQK
jgi:cytochrome c oxidase subunit 2